MNDKNETEATPTGSSSSPRPAWRRYWWILPIAAALIVLFVRALGTPGGDGPTRTQRATPVRAAEIQRGGLNVLSSYAGELTGEISDIAAQVPGLLKSIPARIGDQVRRGDVLAVIDDVDLRNQYLEAEGQVGVAEANELRSEAELESAEAEHYRATDLYEQDLLSVQDYDRVTAQLASNKANLAAAKAQSAQARARLALLRRQLEDSRVLAPFNGTVAERYLDRGVLVQPGTPILRLAEDDSLRLQFRVPERDLGIVRPGVTFTATTVATGESTFTGTVRRVAGEVSRSDRTALVEGELTSSSEILKPGMYAQVEVRLREIRDELIVPDSSVLDRVAVDGTQSTGIFIADPNPETGDGEPAENDSRLAIAKWVPISVLGTAAGKTAIRGEVAPGALVLTLGHGDLRDEAGVSIVQIETFELDIEPVHSVPIGIVPTSVSSDRSHDTDTEARTTRRPLYATAAPAGSMAVSR